MKNMKSNFLTLALVAAMASPVLADNNIATLDQAGSDNTAGITQVYGINTADVLQQGDLNNATVEQVGSDNKATITTFESGSSATIQQGEDNPEQIATNDEATILQDGLGSNTASIQQHTNQDGHDNWASIEQVVGSGNIANIRQQDFPGWNLANQAEASILQMGSDNEAKIDQGAGKAIASIEQYGDGNYGEQFQRAEHPKTATLIQEGNENWGKQTQYTGGWSDVYTDQYGDGNSATIYQHAYNNQADVIQWGNDNFVDLYQAQEDTVSVEQYGDGNSASVSQNKVDDQKGNTANIYVTGNENTTDLAQTGQGNDANVEVLGVSNEIDLVQDNIGMITANYLEVLTSGDGNLVTMNQAGSNAAYVTQTGDFNSATVIQNGTGNYGTITQTGNGNSGSISQ